MATQAPPVPLFSLSGRSRIGLQAVLGGVLVLVVFGWLAVNAEKTPTHFLYVLLVGVTIGAVYGLVALGYSLVYGILELINFAHGDLFMIGGMISATFVFSVFGVTNRSSAATLWPVLLLVLVIVMAACAGINATIEFIAYRRLRNAPRLAPLITAIGASFILQDVAEAIWGSNYYSLPDILPSGTIFSLGGESYRWTELVVVLATVPVLILLIWLVQRTRQGKAMRATAQDMDAAAMMGINVNRTITFTFLIAGALAGAAGLLYVLYETQIRFDQGFQLGLFAFTAAVLGGIGNLPGAVLGGLCIGLIQNFNEGLVWASPGSDWTQSIVFSILILILVFRPEGLLGERTPEGG